MSWTNTKLIGKWKKYPFAQVFYRQLKIKQGMVSTHSVDILAAFECWGTGLMYFPWFGSLLFYTCHLLIVLIWEHFALSCVNSLGREFNLLSSSVVSENDCLFLNSILAIPSFFSLQRHRKPCDCFCLSVEKTDESASDVAKQSTSKKGRYSYVCVFHPATSVAHQVV